MTQKWLFSPCEPFPQTPTPPYACYCYFLLLLAPYKPAPRCLPLVRGLYLAGDLGVENKALGRFFTWNNVCFVDIFRMNLIKREFCSFFEIRGKTFKSRLYWFYFAFSKKQWWMNYELCHFDTKLADCHQEQETQSWLLHVFKIFYLSSRLLYIFFYIIPS